MITLSRLLCGVCSSCNSCCCRNLNVCKTLGMAESYLRRKHILIKEDHILVNLFWTKTIQLGKHVLELPLLPVLNSRLCPVRSMVEMLKLVPGGQEMPLFVNKDGKPITYPVYLKFLKKKIQQVGLDSTNYSTHLFRRGAASWALKCGVPECMIQIMGDWKSNCYKLYVNCPLEVWKKFAKCFINQL